MMNSHSTDTQASEALANFPHSAMQEQFSVAIIGAGAAGIAVAKCLKEARLDYHIFERHTDFGGVWDIMAPDSPMYESAHLISSRASSSFSDQPMDERLPDYPSHRQVLAYLRSYARQHRLYDSATFNTTVSAVKPEGARWSVETHTGRRFIFDAVICTTGMYWDPVMPDFARKAQADATNQCRIMHSREYCDGTSLAGQRVLVVGGGNSGADIACDAAIHAAQATIIVRRGYHFLPKYLFGIPTTVVADHFPTWLPFRLQQLMMSSVLRRTLGSPEQFGLPKPDHGVLETHPVVNSQILHHCAHGDLKVRGDVVSMSGKRVNFSDGSSGIFDTVICATGYEERLPFLLDDLLPKKDGKPDLYLHMFNAEQPTLIVMGMMEIDNGALPVFEACAEVIAHYLQDKASGSVNAQQLEQLMHLRPDTRGNRKLLKSRRHINYVHKPSYLAQLRRLRKLMGWRALLSSPAQPEASTGDVLTEI
ncbi:flavin-containing monooxygenase [Allohahella marinimesophila]|uniref:NAD(P)-binding domain-containing protein n=1 Tax=Allohahella marinimesophila TaxID=1054972 RepID=A0ABP7NL66_9GAMM